jgi:thiol-disulfide isomerase/thioredoxin
MSKLKSTIIMVGLAAAGLAAGFFFNHWQYEKQLAASKSSTSAENALATTRPLFSLKDLDDKTRDVKEWDGQVLMVNFWATWCPPCRKEMPAFIRLQEKYKSKGFKIIGIALDDKQSVIDFTDPMGINYPILMAAQDGIALTKAYGNTLGVLPFTVIVDRKGKIIDRHRSGLTYEEAEALIKPLL